jgi:hypothetical protein
MYFYLSSLVGFAVGTAYLLFRRKRATSRKQAAAKQAEAPLEAAHEGPSATAPTLYKSFEVRTFGLRRIGDQNLDPEKANGDFRGLARCWRNPHDKYAVAIMHDDGRLLGYVPRGNYRLYNTLAQVHQGEVFAWGALHYDPEKAEWEGEVNIPAGLNEKHIRQLRELLSLVQTQQNLLDKATKGTDTYAQLMSNHGQIEQLRKALEYPVGIPYHFPKSLVPSMTKQLEADQAWETLVGLEKYPELVNTLNERYRSSTLKRIAKAKEALGKKE